ncbi:MAG: hypothetical protein ACTTKI_05250 [Tannerella sp.]|uniref:hypothetical protein n=1 Tax=Tannerella sp. TaxID=2382127 RepID=UPI003FA2193A
MSPKRFDVGAKRFGKKKGGIKVHTVIYANERIPSDIRFTSAATNDMETVLSRIIAIYQQRWAIENLFRQIRQNFPLRIPPAALSF